MKGFSALAFSLIITVVLSSCSLEKRVHMSGYHLEWNKRHQPAKNSNAHKAATAGKSNERIEPLNVSNASITASSTSEPDLVAPKRNQNGDLYTSNVKRIDATVDSLEECDIIVLKNGQEIKAKVLEIGVNEIKYKDCDNVNGPTISKRSWDVFMIKYPNGINKVITPEPAADPAPQTYTAAKQVDPVSVVAFSVGLIGVLLALVVVFPFLFGTGAVVLGIIGLSIHRKNPEKYTGKGFAIAGLLLGILAIAIFWAWVVLIASFISDF